MISTMTKNIHDKEKCHIILLKGVDNHCSWLCHLKFISNHSKMEGEKKSLDCSPIEMISSILYLLYSFQIIPHVLILYSKYFHLNVHYILTILI